MRRSRQKVIFALLALFSPVLTSCSSEATDAMNEGFKDAVNGIVPNLWVTIAQLAVFLATALVVFFLAYKPIKKKLKQRQDYIAKNIAASEEGKKAGEVAQHNAQQVIENAKLEAGNLLDKAQKTADEKMVIEQKQLSVSIEQQKGQAHKDIEAERARMLEQAHDQMVEMALTASKQLLQREIKTKDSQKMVAEFLDELEKGQAS